jgi:uncharacterized protein YjiS (DUF1127 family)
MKDSVNQAHFTRRLSNPSPTRVSLALCAASHLLDRLARWHTQRTVARQAKQELQALPNETLKDIGLNRGEINNLAEDFASRAWPCR